MVRVSQFILIDNIWEYAIMPFHVYSGTDNMSLIDQHELPREWVVNPTSLAFLWLQFKERVGCAVCMLCFFE